MDRIDLLLEKFLDGYKVPGGYTAFVYVNPTRKELSEIDYFSEPSARFIADAKTKQVYVWDAGIAIHRLMWDKFKTDSRKLYSDDTLLTGEYNIKTKEVDTYYAAEYNKKEIIQSFLDQDWKWADKYIQDFDRKMKEDLSKRLRMKGDN